MRSLFKGLLLGLIGGVIIGIILSEQRQAREEKAASVAFASDPEVVELRDAWRREKQADAWLHEYETEADNE